MKRKALFFDIDGTLLTDKTKELPESAGEAIRRARAAGHLVFINTGRARCLMQELEGVVEADGYLCGCGTYIEFRNRLYMHHLISAERRLEIQRTILAHGLDGILEGPEGCFVQDAPTLMPAVERVRELFRESGVMRMADWKKEVVPFDKFCVLADENSDVDGFLKAMEPDIACIDRGNGLYECVPASFDKASAMKVILEYFQIPWEESYAFGDSSNDLAMIKYAAHSVIMGEHAKVLEPYAAFITKNVEDDGIAYAFEQLKILDE